MADSSCTIVPKKKVVSPVWDYFGLRADSEGKIIDDGVAVCRQCNGNVRASGGNTSNLLSHLRTHHPSKYTLVLQAQREKAKESSTASSSSTNASQATLPELFHLIPTWQDLEVLESMKAALGQLDDFTDMLSGEQKVTVSSIKPVLHVLKSKVLKVCEGDANLTNSFKQRVLDYLLNKYDDNDVDELLNVCTYLDPRFKGVYIENEVDLALVKDRLAREGTEMIEDQEGVSEPTSSSQSSSAVSDPSIKKRKLSGWLKETVELQSSSSTPQTPDQKIKKEIEDYLKLPMLDAEMDPLQWWKVHMVVLPTMAKLAQKYLSVCASSSRSERIFSCSGNIVSKKRTLLKPGKVNMLVFF